jgi:hypothetical protein
MEKEPDLGYNKSSVSPINIGSGNSLPQWELSSIGLFFKLGYEGGMKC